MCVLVNFPVSVFIFPLFWGVVMYGYKTKEKQKLTKHIFKTLDLCPFAHGLTAKTLSFSRSVA